jgi:hypothetical protein
MHHGEAWRQTLDAKAPSPLRTLGGGEGPLEMSKGDEIELLGETQSTYISIGKPHSLANPGEMPAFSSRCSPAIISTRLT